ncbi:MAG: glycosyltransferase family 2 protein [Rickettsiaceae bacterium]|nr:glycosyltransferase family 2 protein [Rickettsiaceae bacterium]
MTNLAIILCTYNGQKFLKEQLDSYLWQDFRDWSLFVYDDRSRDSTADIVNGFAAEAVNNKIEFSVNKEPQGFARNFMQAIKNTPNDFEFYALSDQDDVWQKQKLSRATSKLKKFPEDIPALYCARTITVDVKLQYMGLSPLFSRKPSFENALVQSLAGGNTMVLNKAAKKLLDSVSEDIDIVSHDWFIYQLISGAGGNIYYDEVPSLLYRQHGSNLVGSNNGIFAKLLRVGKLLKGSFKKWNDRNVKALFDNIDLLSKESALKLAAFNKMRNCDMPFRLINFIKLGLYRQSIGGQIGLIVGIILGKI